MYGHSIDSREWAWPGTKVVIVEYESLDAAKAWYESPEYAPLIPERTATTPSRVLLIEGFVPPEG